MKIPVRFQDLTCQDGIFWQSFKSMYLPLLIRILHLNKGVKYKTDSMSTLKDVLDVQEIRQTIQNRS